MPSFHIPLELDLSRLPERALAQGAELLLEADLPTLAAHTGAELPNGVALTASLPDGRPVPVQYLGSAPGAVVLALPADVAALDRAGLSLLVGAQDAPAKRAAPRVVFSQGQDAVEIFVDGDLFTVYRYNTTHPELSRPYFHPIFGPTGVPITQDGEIPGTKQAHFHHTGLVLAHQKFTDGNNWQIGPGFSRMRHLGFDVMQSGPVLGRFVQRLEWPNAKGDRVLFRESRTVSVPARAPAGRFLDLDTIITCGEQPVTWEATPYHLLAIRVPDAMTVSSGGTITNSEGKTNNAAAGARAKWLDFSGPLGGQCGVAIFDHPFNPRHPTPWLNFENETVGAAPTYHEPYVWKPGESLRFQYRVYLHGGDVRSGRVGEEYSAYAAAPTARIGAPRLVGG